MGNFAENLNLGKRVLYPLLQYWQKHVTPNAPGVENMHGGCFIEQNFH